MLTMEVVRLMDDPALAASAGDDTGFARPVVPSVRHRRARPVRVAGEGELPKQSHVTHENASTGRFWDSLALSGAVQLHMQRQTSRLARGVASVEASLLQGAQLPHCRLCELCVRARCVGGRAPGTYMARLRRGSPSALPRRFIDRGS
jgi:hypothetical protein